MSKFQEYVNELETINAAIENLVSNEYDTLSIKEKVELYKMSRGLVARGEDLMEIIGKIEKEKNNS